MRVLVTFLLALFTAKIHPSAALHHDNDNGLSAHSRLFDKIVSNLSIRHLRSQEKGPSNLDRLTDHLPDEYSMQKAKHHASRILETTHPDMVLENTFESFRNVFFKDWKPKPEDFTGPFVFVIFTVIWLFIYFKKIYLTDRKITLDHWGNLPAKIPGAVSTNPDLVIAFNNPGYDSGDRDKEFQISELHRTDDLIVPEGVLNEKADWMKEHSYVSKLNADRKPADETKGTDNLTITMGHLRALFLQEVYTFLMHKGFHTEVSRSSNNDELYVCASLINEDWRDYYLLREHTKLQLRRHIFGALSVDVNISDAESSPPYFYYNPSLASDLCQRDFIQKPKPEQVYHIPGGRVRAGDRIRIIANELQTYYHLEKAKAAGLIVGWYPAHNAFRISRFKAAWGNWYALRELSFAQPIMEIRDYFGSRLSFTIAWNGFYCKALFAIVPVAVLRDLLDRGMFYFFNVQADQFLGISLIIVIWSRISRNLWLQEEAFYNEEFDVKMVKQVPREDFKGTRVPSPVDHNLTVIENDKLKDGCWRFLSVLITFAFVCAVGSGIYIYFEIVGLKSQVASFAYSIWMVVLQKIYDSIVHKLVAMENHRYNNDYYNSMLTKIMFFSCVNYYGTMVYIALKTGHRRDACPDDDCLGMLRMQVASTFCVILAFRLAGVMYSALVVKAKLLSDAYRHDHQITTQRGTPLMLYDAYRHDRQLATPRSSSYLEQQASYEKNTLENEIEDHSQLVLSLGFVFLFGGIFPLVVPLCLIIFAVHSRSVAVKLVTHQQRPLREHSHGIGNWQKSIEFLRRLGAAMSGFLLVQEGRVFKEVSLVTKIAGVLGFCGLAWALWRIVDVFVSEVDDSTRLLHARRAHVVEKLQYIAHGGELQPPPIIKTDSSKLIRDQAWFDLPLDTSRMPKTPTESASAEAPKSADSHSVSTNSQSTPRGGG